MKNLYWTGSLFKPATSQKLCHVTQNNTKLNHCVQIFEIWTKISITTINTALFKQSIGQRMDQVEVVEVNVVAPDAGRGQGIDWARSLTFATGDFNRHFKLDNKLGF